MTEITVTRLNYYGNDLAYAADASGTRLGRLNLGTGKIVIEVEEKREATTLALQGFARSLTSPATSPPAQLADASSAERGQTTPPANVPPVTTQDTVQNSPPPDVDTDTDLAANRPGELTRARAVEEWEREKRIGPVLARLGRIADAKSEERAWRVGAKGEEVVGEKLNKLRKHGWYVLHSIRVGEKSDIDHLVVGRTGVFLINTKSHPKARLSVNKYGILINGSKTEHISQIRAEVKRATKLLSSACGFPVEITGVIALYNGGLSQPELKHAGSPSGTKVVTNHNINNVFKRPEPVLDQATVEAIYVEARRSSTWAA